MTDCAYFLLYLVLGKLSLMLFNKLLFKGVINEVLLLFYYYETGNFNSDKNVLENSVARYIGFTHACDYYNDCYFIYFIVSCNHIDGHKSKPANSNFPIFFYLINSKVIPFYIMC